MLRPLRLIVADDPLGSAVSLAGALDADRFAPTVTPAGSMADVSAALADPGADLIVASVLEPDQLSERLLEWLGHDPSAPPLVLVVPGETPSNDPAVLQALRLGAWDYVGSEDRARFVGTVERALERRATVPVSGRDDDGTPARRLRDLMRLQGMQKMEAVGRLAGGIAHDFNNIVQTISGYTELLLRGAEASDARRVQLEEIQRAGDRAASLTRQLLAFSRQQVMQPRVLDLNEVVGTMETLLRRLISEDATLDSRLTPDLWTVRADATQIEQVLMNLVVNARDAMPAGGTITLQTANTSLGPSGTHEAFSVIPGEYVLLSVTDTGTGMSPDVKARAFEPFFTTKELGRGTGLGLSTVYGIVKQSGGYIWIDSEPGHGTRVRIYLPREREAVPADDRVPPARAEHRGRETLLVVEDEEGVRDLIREWLEAHGYRVLSASNGVAALELLARYDGPIDLLVADVVMPAMGGPALASRLRPARPDLRVMFMSGYADAALGERRLLGEDTPFLQKPFTLGTLVEKVREALDRGE